MPPDEGALAVPGPAELTRPLPLISPRAWRFSLEAAGSRIGAHLSEGLRLGHRHGFDSGPFMAHVYADRAAGRTPVGRLLDRRLLDRSTCRAFRDVRELAAAAVAEALDTSPRPDPVVCDLASGPAPYVLEAIRGRPAARALLCDLDPEALDGARRAADAAGVAARVRTIRADAFDRDALAAVEPPPDVVVELGLYGIYHDDTLIERHLHDVAELLSPEQIVLNVQTRNPEIEHIARVWRDRRGERCVWRLRPVEWVLGWARGAGYREVSVTADRQEIYRVVRLRQEAAGR